MAQKIHVLFFARLERWGAGRRRSRLSPVAGLILFIHAVGAGAAEGPDFVEQHGRLSVRGAELVDQYGRPVQLTGISSHGLQWYPEFVNEDAMRWLRDDWGINVFRAAMYTDPEANGYIANPAVKEKVVEAVEAAIRLGIYVIIDWHILRDGDPNAYKWQAKEFFAEMAARYGEYPNIIYEIANEPNGDVHWRSHVKPYAMEVIPVIREYDPNNLILVGTPFWSQEIHYAADDPLPFSNVAYVLHFYAGSHGEELRARIDYARQQGVCVFISEWGVSKATGDDGVFPRQSDQWLDFLDARGISWVNWNLSAKKESSAALLPGASRWGGWGEDQLSESGRYVRERLRDLRRARQAQQDGVHAPGG